jgi:hypothetical protein
MNESNAKNHSCGGWKRFGADLAFMSGGVQHNLERDLRDCLKDSASSR